MEIDFVEKAIMVFVNIDKDVDMNFCHSELERLAQSANIEVVGSLVQNIKVITAATYIGSGKLEELKELVEKTNANLIIFNNELSGSQIKNVSDFCDVKVIDRTMLILDIFAKRATTSEGKLQVKLAQLQYTLPRVHALSGTSGRFGSGGVGTRGPGETKLELDKRVIQEEILKIKTALKNVESQRQVKRKQRINSEIKRISVVGYTNAGKSTLINLITKAQIYADDKLFATLETTSRKLWFEFKKEAVITDTVGFVDNLSHSLVSAFASTLEEVKESDLIIHLIDMADNNMVFHEAVVENVLKEIGANTVKTLKVYNKADLSTQNTLNTSNELIISAKNNVNIDLLRKKMCDMLWPE